MALFWSPETHDHAKPHPGGPRTLICGSCLISATKLGTDSSNHFSVEPKFHQQLWLKMGPECVYYLFANVFSLGKLCASRYLKCTLALPPAACLSSVTSFVEAWGKLGGS